MEVLITQAIGAVFGTVGKVLDRGNQRDQRIDDSVGYTNPFADSVNSQSKNNLIIIGVLAFLVVGSLIGLLVVASRRK